jgi:hypothetical protein
MPKCLGNLEPHCVQNPAHRTFSTQCDIVYCIKCGNRGHLDGRRWPIARELIPLRSIYSHGQKFEEIQEVVNALLLDLES